MSRVITKMKIIHKFIGIANKKKLIFCLKLKKVCCSIVKKIKLLYMVNNLYYNITRMLLLKK